MQTEVLYGNGLRTSYTYDERSQLTEMETVFPGMSNPLFRGTYAYDANGCRISKTEQIRMDAKTPLKVMETCYAYESMERLTEENYHTASGAWKIWRSDSRKHASPNSAQTESACAGSLGMAVCLSLLYFL